MDRVTRERWQVGQGSAEAGFHHKQESWLGTLSTVLSKAPYLQWPSERCGIFVNDFQQQDWKREHQYLFINRALLCGLSI